MGIHSQPTEGRVATPTQHTITTITSFASLYQTRRPTEGRAATQHTTVYNNNNSKFCFFNQTRRPTEGRAATQHNTMYNNNNNNSVSKSTPTLNYTVTKAAPSLQ